MKKNVGGIDKIVRYALAVIIALLYYTGVVEGTIGLVLLIFAIILILTGFVNFCPLYTLFGVNTCKPRKAK
jgi:Protein of unknown function (DUF2892).